MAGRWWNGIPLVGRLTTAVVGLLTLGLVLGTAAMVFFLRIRLVEQVDGQLTSTAQTISAVSLQRIIEGGAASGLLPSDHYLLLIDSLYGHKEWVSDAAHEAYGRPNLDYYQFPLATLTDAKPTTVPGEEGGGPWRVITIATGPSQSAEPTGTITIGLPLRPVDNTISAFLHRVLVVDLMVITLGGLLGLLVVSRSMRPLRQIEDVAERIAAGDLTQRVPTSFPATTEVGSLARSLNTMLTQIEASFAHRQASERRMRRFVSDASHELRTPLATVRGYGELYRLGGIPAADLPHAIGRIESEAGRMSGLVENLLTLARMDEAPPLQLEDVDLVVLAADAAADLRALDPGRAVVVVGNQETGLEPVPVRANADQLRQVLANLVGNVVQHTPPGTPVELVVGHQGNMACLEVRDHGSGVPAEDLDKVFGRFYRVDASRSRQSGGSGLGLAIVAAIVAAHAGSAEALATPGGGLTIRLLLPALDVPPTDGHRR